MKGLILNNFYAMQENIKIGFIVSVFLALVALGIKDPKILSVIIAAQICIVMGNIGSSLHVDEKAKWNKMELTLPVKRGEIITAKYLFFIGLVGMGTLFSLMTPLVIGLVGSKMSTAILLDGVSYGLSITLNTIAILYPLILKFGAKKSETMLLIALGLAIGIRFVVWGVFASLVKGTNFNSIEVGVATTVLGIGIFVLSYGVSKWIHKHKNF